MGKSTHSDRTAAWAAKGKNPGYRPRKIVPCADEINRGGDTSSDVKEKEEHNKIDALGLE